jgi:hypothetical protein
VGPLLGRVAHYGAQLAHTSTWCLLEPSRVVFHSFRVLNHLLSSVACLECMKVVPGLFSR